jgi:hypothetical protein
VSEDAFSAHTAREEILFELRDRDHDDKLQRHEFDRGRHPLDLLNDPKRFERFDKDGDGQLSREEWRAGAWEEAERD